MLQSLVQHHELHVQAERHLTHFKLFDRSVLFMINGISIFQTGGKKKKKSLKGGLYTCYRLCNAWKTQPQDAFKELGYTLVHRFPALVLEMS